MEWVPNHPPPPPGTEEPPKGPVLIGLMYALTLDKILICLIRIFDLYSTDKSFDRGLPIIVLSVK